jgi:hypothetical protein
MARDKSDMYRVDHDPSETTVDDVTGHESVISAQYAPENEGA